MNPHALKALEFPRLRERLATCLASPLGERAAAGWGPVTNLEEANRLLDETGQMRRFLEDGELPLAGLALPDDILARTRPTGSALLPAEAVAIGRLCRGARLAKSRIAARRRDLPALAVAASLIPTLAPLEDAIFSVLDDEGAFREDASPELRRIIRESASVRDGIIAALQSLLHRHARDHVFQDDVVAARNGRYALLVKTGARIRLPGMVLDRTDSGGAYYLEPRETVERNNRLVELKGEEEAEKRRLLVMLTDRLRGDREPLLQAAALLGELDLISARAAYGLSRGHHRPTLVAAPGALDLRSARHPLLEERPGAEVVPLDLALAPPRRGLVITGPNTGGKTVVLKTVGLLAAMAQAGLYIPAGEDSSLPLYDDLFADIGDEQSIEQNLSTFSAHVRNIAGAIGGASPRSLAIFDELGAGTDPAEGAPLAMAILEHLLERGVTCLVSTHLGALISFATTREDLENASMTFDPATLQPTYRLVTGLPGRSNAMQVARRMGIPGDVVRRAGELVADGERRAVDLVADLAEQRRLLEERARGAAEREEALARLADRQQAEAERFREAEQARQLAGHREMAALLEEARREVARIRRSAAASDAGAAGEGLERLRRAAGALRPASAGARIAPPDGLDVGARVTLPGGIPGQVASVNRKTGRVTVSAGGKRLVLPAGDLEPAAGPHAPRRARPSYTAVTPDEASRLDIRGLRGEEAQAAMTRFVDAAWHSGLPRAEILHGTGTGRLRQLCVELLSSHPGVARFADAPIEQGGAGITVITFREG
jgi:DNA mismatch repair protein MutS2